MMHADGPAELGTKTSVGMVKNKKAAYIFRESADQRLKITIVT